MPLLCRKGSGWGWPNPGRWRPAVAGVTPLRWRGGKPQPRGASARAATAHDLSATRACSSAKSRPAAAQQTGCSGVSGEQERRATHVWGDGEGKGAALACMRRGAAGALARLGCAAPLEPPFVSYGSSSKPLASDAPRCRSHSCLPCRQSTELLSTVDSHVGPLELSSLESPELHSSCSPLARRSDPHLARSRSHHRLASTTAAADLLSQCSLAPCEWRGGWMDKDVHTRALVHVFFVFFFSQSHVGQPEGILDFIHRASLEVKVDRMA